MWARVYLLKLVGRVYFGWCASKFGVGRVYCYVGRVSFWRRVLFRHRGVRQAILKTDTQNLQGFIGRGMLE